MPPEGYRGRPIDASTVDHRLEGLLQAWGDELIPLVHDWDLPFERLPVELDSRVRLSAEISPPHDAPTVTLSRTLITTLTTVNSNLVPLAWRMLVEGGPEMDACDAFMRDFIELVVAMSPPDAPLPDLRARVTRPGWNDYRDRYDAAVRYRLRRDGVALLTRLAGASGDIVGIARNLAALVARYEEPEARFQRLECQIKFLILHELAHVALGHLRHDEATIQQELEADRLAADVYLASSQAGRASGQLMIDGPALATLFSALTFAEDVMRLADRAIWYAIPEALRAWHQPIVNTHPCIRQRAGAVLSELDGDGFTQLISFLSEWTIREIKGRFRQGVLDASRFKWYCRIRATEMQAGGFMRQMRGKPDAHEHAEMIRIVRGWDTADLQWGPLVPEIFPADWDASLHLSPPGEGS